MPTRKQRRRRAKDRRHEYEYVYVDEEGHEVEVAEAAEERKASDKRPPPKARSGRTIEPPSWSRIGKRALLFAPLMFLVTRLLGKNLSIFASITQTVILLALFLPFSYLMDSMLYRSHVRRTAARSGTEKKR